MASFKFDEIPESNKNINFEFKMKDNKCVNCKKFYGVLVDGKYLCSECSGLMDINKKNRNEKVLQFIEKFKILDKKNFRHFRVFCNKLSKMYSIGGKLKIPQLCYYLRKYIILMLSGNFKVHDEWGPIFNNNNDDIEKIDELKYLFSISQCEEILNLFKGESFRDEYHFISNCMARYLKTPWIQSNIFHPSSMCYHGNFGEVKYCGYQNFYYSNHFDRLPPK